MYKLLLTLLVLSPATALTQVPQSLSYQGRLMKADGDPETGSTQFGFAVFDVQTGGAALWSERQSLALTDGYYSTAIGTTTPLTADVFSGHRWIELSVEGTPLAPRQPIGSVPFALVANSISGGTVSASSATVGGNVGIATGSPAARLHAVGAPVRPGTAGTVGINGTAFRTLSGTGTSFKQSGVMAGDAIVVTTAAGTYIRIATEVVDDATLTVDAAYPIGFSGASYTVQKPVARLDTADGIPRVFLNGLGDLGVGTATPSQRFHVAGIGGGNQTIAKFGDAPGAIFLTHSDPVVSANCYYDNGWYYDGAGAASYIDLVRGQFVFATAPSGTPGATATWSERMIITNDGRVGIGTKEPDSTLHVPKGAHFNGITVGAAYPGATATNAYETIALATGTNLRLNFGSTERFMFTNTGSAYGGPWLDYSDERLKTNIRPISNPRTKALALRGVAFDWKESGEPSIGFIAQEVEKVLPELVSADPRGFKAVDYSKLTSLLIEALKAQDAELDQRRKDVDELRSENRALERRLSKLESALEHLQATDGR